MKAVIFNINTLVVWDCYFYKMKWALIDLGIALCYLEVIYAPRICGFLFNVPLMGLHTCVRLPPLTFWPSSQGSSFSACVLSVNASSDFCPCFCFFFNVCFVPLLNRGPQTFLDIALTGEFSKLHTARPLQIVLWGQLRFLSSSCDSDVHQKLRNTALLPENVTHHHCLLTLESHTLWSSKSFP